MHDDLATVLDEQSPFQRRIHHPFKPERSRLIHALALHHALAWQDFDLSEAAAIKSTLDKLAQCCANPQVQWSEEQQKIRVVQQRCRHRLCPLCQRQRSYDVQRKLQQLVSLCDSPRFLTLTLKSSDEPLAEQLRRLIAAFAKLRRSKLWKATQRGGCYTIECTYNHARKQWHPHIHAVIEGQFVEHARLKEAWSVASDGSSIVDIRLVKSRRALCNYLAKYIAKSNSVKHVPDDEVWHWALAVRGLRMIGTFGILHAVKLERDQPEETAADAESLAPLNALIEADENGDTAAAVILERLRRLQQHRISDGAKESPQSTLPDEREIASRIRSWWSRQQENKRHELTALHDSSRCRGPDQRSLWQRQEQHDGGSDLPV